SPDGPSFRPKHAAVRAACVASGRVDGADRVWVGLPFRPAGGGNRCGAAWVGLRPGLARSQGVGQTLAWKFHAPFPREISRLRQNRGVIRGGAAGLPPAGGWRFGQGGFVSLCVKRREGGGDSV